MRWEDLDVALLLFLSCFFVAAGVVRPVLVGFVAAFAYYLLGQKDLGPAPRAGVCSQ